MKTHLDFVFIFSFDRLLTLNNIPSVLPRKSMRWVQVQMRPLFSIPLQVTFLQMSFLLMSPWGQVVQKEKHWWWVRKWQKRLLLAQHEPSSSKVKTWVRVVNVTKNNHLMTLKSLHRINDKTAMRKTEMGPTQRTIRQLFCTY